ncbi:hypothetical protein [Nannocystis pusilla]|uniref:hypothetical protein n=1 Tax=Nannocystis pusilla TaxID=889268 RepID=UPI003B7C8AB6
MPASSACHLSLIPLPTTSTVRWCGSSPIARKIVLVAGSSPSPAPRSTTPLCCSRTVPWISYSPGASSTAPRSPSTPSGSAPSSSIACCRCSVLSPATGPMPSTVGTSGIGASPR